MTAKTTTADRLCACFDISRADVRRYMSKPGATIDGLVSDTGIGTKCTACLLDLEVVLADVLMQDQQGARAVVGGMAEDWRDLGPGLVVARDYLDSGFLIGGADHRTELVCANVGIGFGQRDSMPEFAYSIRILSADGQEDAPIRGLLKPGETLRRTLAGGADTPAEGWFLLHMKAQQLGLEGSIRPQMLIHGPAFVTSVHTQPHHMACRGKAVMLLRQEGKFSAKVSLINGNRQAVHSTFDLSGAGGLTSSAVSEIPLGALCSRMIDLDDVFGGELLDGAYVLSVASDAPIRKHIINVLADGTWSIDHLPNSK